MKETGRVRIKPDPAIRRNFKNIFIAILEYGIDIPIDIFSR